MGTSSGFNPDAVEAFLDGFDRLEDAPEDTGDALLRASVMLRNAVVVIRQSDDREHELAVWLRENGLLLKKHEGMPWAEVVRDILTAPGVRGSKELVYGTVAVTRSAMDLAAADGRAGIARFLTGLDHELGTIREELLNEINRGDIESLPEPRFEEKKV